MRCWWERASRAVASINRISAGSTNPKVIEIQTHKVRVDGDLYLRDGMKYLLVDRIITDAGIVNQTHQEYGIQPFGE